MRLCFLQCRTCNAKEKTMNNDVKILNSTTDFNAYFNTNSISEDTRKNLKLQIFLLCLQNIKKTSIILRKSQSVL